MDETGPILVHDPPKKRAGRKAVTIVVPGQALLRAHQCALFGAGYGSSRPRRHLAYWRENFVAILGGNDASTVLVSPRTSRRTAGVMEYDYASA